MMENVLMEKKTCGNCVNVDKIQPKNGKEFWACDTYGILHFGCPANCTPPNDEACEHWTDDPRERNKIVREIERLF